MFVYSANCQVVDGVTCSYRRLGDDDIPVWRWCLMDMETGGERRAKCCDNGRNRRTRGILNVGPYRLRKNPPELLYIVLAFFENMYCRDHILPRSRGRSMRRSRLVRKSITCEILVVIGSAREKGSLLSGFDMVSF